MNIVVCDDEKYYVDIIESALEKLLQEQGIPCEITTFSSGEALLASNMKQVDVCLLDVKMMKWDGFQTAQRIHKRNVNCGIIFLSNYPDDMGEGYRVNAIRYLPKLAINSPFFEEAVMEAIHRYHRDEDYVKISINREDILVPIHQILYLERNVRKITIVMTKSASRDKYEFYGSMNRYANLLNSKGFDFCHQSFLVNFKYVKNLEKDSVIMTEGDPVPISRGKGEEFRRNYYLTLGDRTN